MASLLNTCRFTATAGGTGTWTVSAEVQGYKTPAQAGAADGGIYPYRSESSDLTEWEEGYGTYTVSGTTFARTRIVANSNGDTSPVDFSAAPQIALTVYAEDLVYICPPQGRLTLQTAEPVMNVTRSGKTTIYYTPYVGQQIPIYDGTSFRNMNFSEIEITGGNINNTTKNPAAIGASKVNDWFVWDDAGTPTLSHGPDWTDDTTPSVGSALVKVNGIDLNSVAITNGPAASRGTWVGTTRSNASSQLEWIFGATAAGGTAGFFGVWNAYNRVNFSTFVGNSTDNWTYAVATTWRAPNGSANMRVSMVRGRDEDGIQATYRADGIAGAATQMAAGVGLDSTTAFSGTPSSNNSNSITLPMTALYSGHPGRGFHFVSAIEYNTTTTASTWIGDNGAAFYMTGLHVTFRA